MKGVTCGKRKTVTGRRGFFERRKTCPQLFHRFRFFQEAEVESFSRLNGWIVLLGLAGGKKIKFATLWNERKTMAANRIHFLEKYRWFKKSSIFQYFLCTRISVSLFCASNFHWFFHLFFYSLSINTKIFPRVSPDLYLSSFFCDIIIHVVS